MPKKYKHIEILEEGTVFSNKIRITYEDGTKEEVEASPEKRDDFNECYDHLINFAKQEGFVSELGIVDLRRFLENGNVTLNLEEKKPILEEEPVEIEEYEVDTEYTEEEPKVTKTTNKKETKGKKKSMAVRIGTICLGALLALGGGYIIGRNSNSNGNSNDNSDKDNGKTNNSFVQIVDKPEEDNLTFEEKLNEISKNSDKIAIALSDMVNGKLQNSEELDKCLENMANASLANITEISNYVTGYTSNITGDKVTVNFRAPFEKDSVEFNAVDHFNGLRDNVIEAAYTKKSVDETKKCVTTFNKEFVEFVLGDKALPYEIGGTKVYYTFENLSPSAKMTIFTMGMTMLNIEHDFSINVDGVEYNRIVAITEAYNLNQAIYQELAKTQQYSKTK